MPRPASDPLPPLEGLLSPLGTFEVEARPGASRASVAVEEGVVRVAVTAAPEKGRANEAIRAALARAFGVPKTALELVRGGASRRKLFRLRR